MITKPLDVAALFGMDLDEAKKLIFSREWRYRVVREDGRDYLNQIPTDKKANRVLLTVVCKVVTNAVEG